MTDPLPSLLRRIDALDQADLLRLHREVCRRAASVYEPMYKAVRDANWKIAMGIYAPQGTEDTEA